MSKLFKTKFVLDEELNKVVGGELYGRGPGEGGGSYGTGHKGGEGSSFGGYSHYTVGNCGGSGGVKIPLGDKLGSCGAGSYGDKAGVGCVTGGSYGLRDRVVYGNNPGCSGGFGVNQQM